MGALKIIFALLVIVILASLVMILTKRFRKKGLLILGTLIIVIVIAILRYSHPKQYERKYLQESSQWKSLHLREYSDSLGFYLGAIPGGREVTDPLFCENFNSLTPENALKMGPLLRNENIGEYDFSYADKIVNEALEKNIRVRGHTLVWGKQSDAFKNPDLNKWLEKFSEEERGKKLKEIIDNHIVTVLKHFKGRIHIWDCVNEPTSMFRPGKLEKNVYFKYLGEDYIPDAFKLAHSIDPDVKLYLNENFISYNDKQAGCFVDLVKKLKANNIPVNGIGIQSHIASNRDTAIIDLQNFMKKFTDMGLEVEITELDMRLRLFDDAGDPYEAQGKYYARLINACMSNPLCKGVTFWGFSDSVCWMDQMGGLLFPKPNEPYLFDKDLNPKPAFYELYKTLLNRYKSEKGI